MIRPPFRDQTLMILAISPRRNVPKVRRHCARAVSQSLTCVPQAIRRVFYRILFFYVFGVFMVR